MSDIVERLRRYTNGSIRDQYEDMSPMAIMMDSADTITALRQQLADAQADHTMVSELYAAAVTDYDNAHRQLAEAVEVLEPFARIGGYFTEECGWTPDDEIELMFGDRGHVLATTEARHFIRAREVHRKAKRRSPVEKQNSGDNP